MLVYWIMLGLAVTSLFLRRNPGDPNNQQQTIFLTIVAILFAIIIGLRHEVGGDWETYLLAYQRAELASQQSPHVEVGDDSILGFLASISRDPGYAFYNWLAVMTQTGIYGVNFLVGASLMGGILFFALQQPKPSNAFIVSVPYLIIVIGMGYSRQAAAIGFELVALVHLGQKKSVHYVCWILVAALFHKSAVVMMPLAALISTRGLTFRIAWIGVTSAIAAYYLVGVDNAQRLWDLYVGRSRESSGALIRGIMNAAAGVIYLGLLWWQEKGPNRNAYIAISIVALICVPLSLIASTATDRMALYLIPLQLYVASRLELALGQIAEIMLVVACIVIQFVWLNYATHAKAWVPYQFFF